MFCPSCGNEMDLFADKCLSCGKMFVGMSIAQRKQLSRGPIFQKAKHAVKKRKPQTIKPKKSYRKQFSDVKKPKRTTARIEYNNGYATAEGMSITGTKLKKGSFKKRFNNEGSGMRLPRYGLGECPY